MKFELHPKKLLLGLGALLATLTLVPLLAAFEAHVLNVTAQINNTHYLNPIADLDFATVFPQEKLDKTFEVALGTSFLEDPTLDDLEYSLRQKPKCVDAQGEHPGVLEDEDGNFVCPEGSTMMPLLCPYLSKEEITADGEEIENDGPRIPPFHGLPDIWTLATTILHQTNGRLIQSANDLADTWNIDLKVPCFRGSCAQDWPEFVRTESGSSTIDFRAYELDPALESQIFGCDLWIEVTATSSPPGCDRLIDLILVLDRSGSIDSTELSQLKTAAKDFVDAIAPSASGSHVGLVTFASTGTLDIHLTDDGNSVKTAIDAIVAGGFTHLKGGIDLATGEFDDLDPHERPAVPDKMVIVTDGAPNRPLPANTATTTAAIAADNARAAGIEIFVLGVGVTPSTEAFLKAEIADTASHYFSVADFASLSAALQALATCPD